ncbi:patatin-like phospholipase family protein [Aureimonas mangrovi]|uniref:patatin-like phospholipase family protein n=1 Tax=Aureimonas mangrovi TaxID=2758041 RepID=UPI00163D889D|nr:patatin-like phospholipase family protein [Aureimonas mangrovi]
MAAKKVCLALQGGGAHGAFTWGVLDRLLEIDAIEVAAVSGTSAGAMNAAALVTGYLEGGADAARQSLERFWRTVAHRSPLGAAERQLPGKSFLPFADSFMRRSLETMRVFGQLVSPYHPALPGTNALRGVIEETIDLERLASQRDIPVFVAATEVESGRARIFTGPELGADALLASACLPNLFRAVKIGGTAYWDGGYVGNPPLAPLYGCDCGTDDLLLVQVTPFERASVPEDASEIMNRVNEITFNASLLRDLRTVAQIQRLAKDEHFADRTLRAVAALRVHMIAAGSELQRGGTAGKLDTRFSALTRLRDLGRAAAESWMGEHYGDVGMRTSAREALASLI